MKQFITALSLRAWVVQFPSRRLAVEALNSALGTNYGPSRLGLWLNGHREPPGIVRGYLFGLKKRPP